MLLNYSVFSVVELKGPRGIAGQFEAGTLHIEVVKGDIVEEETDAIVNSIGPYMNVDKAGMRHAPSVILTHITAIMLCYMTNYFNPTYFI